MTNRKIKIMIVDDHIMFLDGLKLLINEFDNIELKYVLNNGKKALETLQKDSEIDVLISDIDMPELSGVELCKAVKSDFPDVKVLILSMHSDTKTIKELLNAGALGYILKNTGKTELQSAIETVNKDETYFSEEVKNNIMQSITKARKKASSGINVKLSAREIEIITLISEEYTTNEIAEKLFISLHTVESHRKNILRKTNSRNLAGLIKYAVKEGIVE